MLGCQYVLTWGRQVHSRHKNYVVLRRFSAKEERRRLIAAPFLSCAFDAQYIGLENHLNYIHRLGGSLSDDETYGLAALFNSALLDAYFRSSNGNTQISATEVRAMPLPSLEAIKRIGQQVMGAVGSHAPANTLQTIDEIVQEVLDVRDYRDVGEAVSG